MSPTHLEPQCVPRNGVARNRLIGHTSALSTAVWWLVSVLSDVIHGVTRVFLLLILFSIFSGCSSQKWRSRGDSLRGADAAPIANPLVIPAASQEEAWERSIDVLHAFHFEIERENRQARTIETRYRVGSGVMEPWHRESVGWENRLESTLQSIRRKVVVTVTPVKEGKHPQYAIQVVALKELEDIDALTANSPGGATFQETSPLKRDLTPVLGQSRPSGWIPQGRDLELERAILVQLHQ